MKSLSILIAVIMLSGCGLFGREEVASDIPIDGAVTGESSNIISRIDLMGVEASLEEAPGLAEVLEDQGISNGSQVNIDLIGIDPAKRVDVTDRVIAGIESPTTGPAIPEDEMRAILNARLVESGQSPLY